MRWKVASQGTLVRVPDIYVGNDAYDTYEEAADSARRMLEARMSRDREALKRLENEEAT